MIFEDQICLPSLNLIHRRSRLLNLLARTTATEKSLVIIEAPSGTGKSVLLADFAQTTDLPVCWCTLQLSDREPVVLLQLLVHSLANRFYELNLGELLGLIKPLDVQHSILQLAQSLTRLGPHLIIFDDYHKAAAPSTVLIIQRLLEHFPKTSRFIIAGQSGIKPLTISPQSTVLSQEILAFTTEEVQALLLKRFGIQLDSPQAEAMRQASQGNGAQILLQGHIMHMAQLKRSLEQKQEITPATLNQVIFKEQSVELQNFLLATSVLPEVTPRLANQLLETDSATHLIRAVRSKNLFISPTGVGYKYHPHFAKFLHTQLTQAPKQHYHLLTSRAAQLMIENGRFEEALELYLSCQAWAKAADLLEQKGRYFIDQVQAKQVAQWLTHLPKALHQRRGRLLLLRGQIDLKHRLDETPDPIFALCDQAETEFLEQNDRRGTAEVALLRSARWRLRGQLQGAIQLAVKSLDQLIATQAGDELIARALQNRGIAYSHIGQLTAALTDTHQALEMFKELEDFINIGCCHQEIGQTLAAQGNLHQAQHHLQQAIRIWESQGHALKLAHSLNSLGETLITLGDYAKAQHQFEQSFEIAQQLEAKQLVAMALNGQGQAYMGLHAFDKAMQVYDRFSKLKIEDDSLEIHNRINLSEYKYQLGHLFEALELATQAKVLTDKADFREARGVATALQGKIYVAWAEYEASFRLFQEALSNLTGLNVLEQIKVRLWWGYSLLLDLRTSAAFEQLRTAINLILTVDELRYGLGETIIETQQLLTHFLYNCKTPPGMHNSLELLLQQGLAPQITLKKGLQFFTFGPPMLVINGLQKNFSRRGRRARKLPEVLAYLLFASRNRGCRWDELSAAIWPELEPDSASARFHQSIRRLRDAILGAPDCISVQNDYYQINPAYAQWCDILVFEKLFDRMSLVSPEASLDLQLEIIDLYQGEFLAGFELEEWGHFYRIQCESRFLRTVKMASDQLLQIGQPWKALMVAKRGLNQDYFREDLHHNVLSAYSKLGLRGELQSYYQQMQGIFQRELGEPPLPETDQLYQKLKAQI